MSLVIERTMIETSHFVGGHILYDIYADRPNPQVLRVKRTLAYCTKEASTYIGYISIRLKLRSNSPLVR